MPSTGLKVFQSHAHKHSSQNGTLFRVKNLHPQNRLIHTERYHSQPRRQLTDDELDACLKGMRDGKAYGIPIEVYKSSPTSNEELYKIVSLIWDREEFPSDIVKGVFIMKYKNKDRNDFKKLPRHLSAQLCLK